MGGIFFMAYIFYSRSFSRNLIINKGALRLDPLSRMIWIFLIIACISAPPSINLFAEIFFNQCYLFDTLYVYSYLSESNVINSLFFDYLFLNSTGVRSYENFYKVQQCQMYGLLI